MTSKKSLSHKPKQPGQRHQSRIYAMQALFQWHFTRELPEVVFQHFLVEHIQVDKPADMDFARLLFFGTAQNCDAIDALMSPHLDRNIALLNPVELSVLRLAIYEMQHHPEVPKAVIINEAIELTKEFGAVEGYKFVNGVLNALMIKKSR